VTQSELPKRSRERRRKVAAILAGGLVVGIGTMATLASWNDVEYASGTFTAGSFDMVGSTDNSTFAQHKTEGAAATLTFSTPVSAMSPGDVVAAPYALKLDKASTNAATVVVTAGTSSNITGLTYGLYITSAFGCTASTTALSTVVPAGSALNAATGASSFTLAKPASTSVDGAPVYLCVKVTADSALTQAQAASATWVLTATSS
jgi:predicted ribosomally synthesized peptide with SipW-like signal peptide